MSQITFKGNPIHTRESLPQVGMKAPDFRLVGQDLSDQTLKNFRGKKKLLSIVPSLDTSVCSIMTKRFNDEASKLKSAIFLVISCDLPFAQKRFCSAEHTDRMATLSVMRDRRFAEDYGVLIADGPLEGICARAVFVLDEQDQIVYVELVPEVTQEPKYEQALAHLRE